jgi:hypothetical protein
MFTSTILALTALLSATPATVSLGAPPPTGDILRGPDVPQDALKPDRARKPDGATAIEKVSRPVLEQRVFSIALDKLALDDATRKSVNAMRDEFVASVAAYEKVASVKRKEIFDERKKAPTGTGKPPSDEFKKAMEELEAKRPKLASLRAKIETALTKEQNEQLRANFDEAMKRAREEMTRRAEEERKQKGDAKRKTPAPAQPEMETPATDKPATEKPATEKPATEKPATENRG